MKKFLYAVLLGCLLVLALSITAQADNGPHGSFTATTDACASCHRSHTAQYGNNALLIVDPETLCLSCHDGTGAATNVVDGVYVAAAGAATEGINGQSLWAGGFEHALMNSAWSGSFTFNPALVPQSRETTSMHSLATSGIVWGSGANNSQAGNITLECTSCHDPHGTAGWNVATNTRVASYRLLRWQPQGSNGFAAPVESVNWSGGAFPTNASNVSGWLVPDTIAANGMEWYTINSDPFYDPSLLSATSNSNKAFALADYSIRTNLYVAPNNNTAGNTLVEPLRPFNYSTSRTAVSFFCAQCHDRYFNNTRLRNGTDASMYCGSPFPNDPILPYKPDADGVAPWIHPEDSTGCQPVYSTAGALSGWGDDRPSGDLTYMYRHSSGDARAPVDGSSTSTSGGQACLGCHVAHGTASQMSDLAHGASLATGSTLLRLDNRSVCLKCHTSTVNFTPLP
jgi:predicted CXXCH cytochrome family protein